MNAGDEKDNGLFCPCTAHIVVEGTAEDCEAALVDFLKRHDDCTPRRVPDGDPVFRQFQDLAARIEAAIQ